MRCHAMFLGFRCDQDMSQHNPEEHSFWIRWTDDGEPLVEMPTVALVRPTLDQPISEILAREAQEVDPLPGERGYQVVDGAIRFDEIKSEVCMICGHAWHDEPCTVTIDTGQHRTGCGCETAA